MPKDKEPLFVNEPWITDKSLLDFDIDTKPENAEDNIRVYIPLDLSFESILRRLDRIISFYGEANEDNELEFSMDVGGLISQIEIYDQIWSVRHMPESGKHSEKAIKLVKEFVKMLEDIPDGCAEVFPFETIDSLRGEYLE